MNSTDKWNNFHVEPQERAWFVKYDGEKMANDTSHKQILKDWFPKDWKHLATNLPISDSDFEGRDANDPLVEAEAERTFTNRLLRMEWVKIGEIGGSFYMEFCYSDKEALNTVKKFAESILKARNGIENNDFVINNTVTGSSSKYTVLEVSKLA